MMEMWGNPQVAIFDEFSESNGICSEDIQDGSYGSCQAAIPICHRGKNDWPNDQQMMMESSHEGIDGAKMIPKYQPDFL